MKYYSSLQFEEILDDCHLKLCRLPMHRGKAPVSLGAQFIVESHQGPLAIGRLIFIEDIMEVH